MEVPHPLSVEVTKSEGDIRIVLADILTLTKINYNTLTLKFADAVGDVLTAGPSTSGNPPNPCRSSA